VDRGHAPAWNPTGREFFFVASTDTGDRMMSVAVTLGATAALGTPRLLFEFGWDDIALDCGPVNCYSVAPDGQRFFTAQKVKTGPPAPVTHINLLQNWRAELEAKVPSGF
jgi:hypothetical protein